MFSSPISIAEYFGRAFCNTFICTKFKTFDLSFLVAAVYMSQHIVVRIASVYIRSSHKPTHSHSLDIAFKERMQMATLRTRRVFFVSSTCVFKTRITVGGS